jgi:pimeloyl-ACP methyl ester carboxylesterase
MEEKGGADIPVQRGRVTVKCLHAHHQPAHASKDKGSSNSQPAVIASPTTHVARDGKIELEYEAWGDPKNPAILMIMGLGAQLIHWPEKTFVRPLAAAGYYVIRYDNRDAGLSSHLPHLQLDSLLLRRVKFLVNGLFRRALVPGLLLALAWTLWTGTSSGGAFALSRSAYVVLALLVAAALLRWLDRVPKLAIRTGYRFA